MRTANPLELKRRIGVLPEDLGLFDDLTVEEHLLLTGDIYGVPRQETRARTTQLLHALSLEHGRRTFAAACSHGMRKKTAFAMALLPNPKVLFLDEPFEAIDPVTAKIMRDLLQSVARHGVTVFLTSHILSMVERIAHQIVMIRKGTKVWDSAGRRTAAIARGPLFRSGGDARGGGVGMARPFAILRALGAGIPPRLDGVPIPRRQQFLPDHRLPAAPGGDLRVPDHGAGRAVSAEYRSRCARFRLRAWPCGRWSRRERWILRLASPWINPLTWGLAGARGMGRGRTVSVGLWAADRRTVRRRCF